MATNSQETPEYRTFREHYDRLYHAIQDPLSLATRLFSRGIITSVVKEKVTVSALTRLEKNDALLTAVLGKIRTDPRMFCEFLSTLKDDPSMQSLVESMESKCLLCAPISVFPISYTCTWGRRWELAARILSHSSGPNGDCKSPFAVIT